MDLMKPNTSKNVCILILSLSFVLVTTQGISYTYFKYSAEGSNSGNGIGISPPDINIESDDNNKNVSDLPDLIGGQGDSEGNNETGNGLLGGVLSGNTSSESSNETGNGDSDDDRSSESSNVTGETEDQNNNLDININNNIEIKQRLDLMISEEEGEAPIPKEEQDKVESQDKIVVTERKGITGPDCRSGNVLDGASNAEDLRILAECQDAIGTVMHTKKMDDGDYKFFLKVDEQFKFLVNEKNDEKTDGFLVVEIVPPHQDGMYLPKDGDRVHVWGAWVTDKPKGWHEIHPTWKVVNQ
jgi:hypothetical protein